MEKGAFLFQRSTIVELERVLFARLSIRTTTFSSSYSIRAVERRTRESRILCSFRCRPCPHPECGGRTRQKPVAIGIGKESGRETEYASRPFPQSEQTWSC